MKQSLTQSIADFLSFSKEISGRVCFEAFAERHWHHSLVWLHDAGLALYFLEKVKVRNKYANLPPAVLTLLEDSQQNNQQRVSQITKEFCALNRKFEDAGVTYAAVKGFSLIPEYCPRAHLRQQSDFDYIITEESLPSARRVLEHAGYSVRTHTVRDYVFCLPDVGFTPTLRDQYNPNAPCPVELHLSLWSSNARDIFLREPQFWHDQLICRQWEGRSFRGLRDEVQFLFQITHVFYHISNYWIRLSWLLEIAYFLQNRWADLAFWRSIEQVTADSPLFQEIVVLIATLAQQFFGAPLPALFEGWELRPAARLWVREYSRAWVLGNSERHNFSFWPAAKLALFLLRNYVPDQKQFISSRLFPTRRLTKLAHALKANPSRFLDGKYRSHERIIRRTLFHLAANLRYICEKPRWNYRNRTAA